MTCIKHRVLLIVFEVCTVGVAAKVNVWNKVFTSPASAAIKKKKNINRYARFIGVVYRGKKNCKKNQWTRIIYYYQQNTYHIESLRERSPFLRATRRAQPGNLSGLEVSHGSIYINVMYTRYVFKRKTLWETRVTASSRSDKVRLYVYMDMTCSNRKFNAKIICSFIVPPPYYYYYYYTFAEFY